jgi:hydroxyacylglutathione hydrolase
MLIRQFELEGLGHLSALVADESAGVAAIVDPRRDVDVYLEAAAAAGVRITHVVETHLHNDYVSGARELAALTGATHLIGVGAELRYEYRPLRDHDAFDVGSIRLTTLDTPGHTPEHVAFEVIDGTATTTAPTGRRDRGLLFTGGSLLVGSVGRTDLLGPESAAPLARQMYHSLHDVLLDRDDAVAVYPTHGAGSLCSTGLSSERSSTIGRERRSDPLLRPMEVEAFVHALLNGQPDVPGYFARMRPMNQAGPRLVGAHPPLPPTISVEAARGVLERGGLLIDARSPLRHAHGHPAGAMSIPADPLFGTWLGWVVEPDRPLVLLVRRPADLDDLVRQAYRVGYEALEGFIEGGWPAWQASGEPTATLPSVSVEQLARLVAHGGRSAPILIDVRQTTEFESGHVPGSWHLMAGWLPDRLSEVPRDRPLATICASGYRASIAASLLQRAGFADVVRVEDGVDTWEAAGYPIERGAR